MPGKFYGALANLMRPPCPLKGAAPHTRTAAPRIAGWPRCSMDSHGAAQQPRISLSFFIYYISSLLVYHKKGARVKSLNKNKKRITT